MKIHHKDDCNGMAASSDEAPSSSAQLKEQQAVLPSPQLQGKTLAHREAPSRPICLRTGESLAHLLPTMLNMQRGQVRC